MEALGRLFDLSCGVAPVDFATAASTGKRVSLRNCGGVTIIVFKEAGANEDPTYTLKEHTASTGGTSQNLAVIDSYYHKREATLDGDETWTRATQTAAATVTGDGDVEEILVIEVDGTKLSADFDYISLDVSDSGATAGQLGCVLYVLRDLDVQRAPANLVAPLS